MQLQLPARVASALQKPLCPPVPGAGAVGWSFVVLASLQALPGRLARPMSGALAWLSQASDTPRPPGVSSPGQAASPSSLNGWRAPPSVLVFFKCEGSADHVEGQGD